MAWRKQSLHRRHSSLSRFFTDLFVETKPKISHIDAEHLTQQERLSRMLHTPRGKSKIPSTGSLFDHFLVIGAENPVVSDTPATPQILYKNPSSPITLPGICDFCFPTGVTTTLYSATERKSNTENSFVFLMTDEQKNNIYGICVYKYYVLDGAESDRASGGSASGVSTPVQIPTIKGPTPPACSPTSPQNTSLPFPMPTSRTLITTPRCFCFVSRFPFFQLHFDVLDVLLDMEEAAQAAAQATEQTINRSANSSLRGDEEAISISTATAVQADRASTGSVGSLGSTSILYSSEKISSYNALEEDELSVESTVVVRQDLPPPSPRSGSGLNESALMKIRRLYESSTGKGSFISGTSTPAPPAPPPLVYDCILLPKDWTDQTAINMVAILERYRSMPIPLPGETFRFQATDEKCLVFTRPVVEDGEEELMFGECCVPLALNSLSRRLLLLLFAAVLLEKKIVFISSDVRTLSALVLSWMALIRPFKYQSVVIPILPNSMFSFLEAPVPFIVGVATVPPEIPSDVISVHVKQSQLKSPEPIPQVPETDTLRRKLDKEIEKAKLSKLVPIPGRINQKDLQSITKVFSDHLEHLFSNFHQHTLRNLTDPHKPITVFLKESFLSDFDEDEGRFLMPFLDTQIFFHYSDECLRQRDCTDVAPQRSQSVPNGLIAENLKS